MDKVKKEISKAEFKSWMVKNGFEAFKWYWINREPKYWRIDPCLEKENFCLVMEERKSSSHIVTKLKNPIPLSDKLKFVMEHMVEAWPKQTDLAKKEKEDAALRVFLSADLDGRKVHLGLTATKDHKPGQIIASQREPEKIKYIVLDIDTSDKGVWQRSSAPIAASFQKAFGTFAKAKILAIGIKSDGNNTASDVKVWLRKLKIE